MQTGSNPLPYAATKQSGRAFQAELNRLNGTRFELRPIGRSRLDGEILGGRYLDLLKLADLRFSAHSTRLMPGRPREMEASILISWQIEGSCEVAQAGRQWRVNEGEIFILNTAKPFEIETEDMRTRSVYLRPSVLREGFPEYEDFTAIPFDSQSGAGAVCAGLISHMFEGLEHTSANAISRVAHGLSHLLALSLFETGDGHETRLSPESERIMRVKRFIRLNLGDPALDCNTISKECGVSLRQLHNLFSKEGTTVMRWVWSERLKHIAKDLENPLLAHRTISSLAFDWGFSEAAHFSRSFKAVFGQTPLKYRQDALGKTPLN